jgi:hypothetical protein
MSKRNSGAAVASATSTSVSAVAQTSTDTETVANSTSDIIRKAFKRNARWDKDSFPEYLVIVYWIRQIIGLLVGLACGVSEVTGFIAFVIFILNNTLVPFAYYRHYSNINIEDFGPTEVLTEGYQQSFGIFLLTWIISYTLFHA